MPAVHRYIEDLPLVDDPEIFGLHGNADLAYRSSQTKAVLGTILDIQPKEGGGGGGLTREEVVLKMVEDLQAKLPPDFKADDVKTGIKALGGMGKPLNICLKLEIDRLQKVLPPHSPPMYNSSCRNKPLRHLTHAPPNHHRTRSSPSCERCWPTSSSPSRAPSSCRPTSPTPSARRACTSTAP